MKESDTAPDIETASEEYASRFAGEAGEFFLQTQEKTLLKLLAKKPLTGAKVLEVGGGHGQLTEAFLRHGSQVWVQGSSAECFARLAGLMARYPENLHFVESSIFSLPFDESSFDVVIAIRLFAHVPRWTEVLEEMIRVSADKVVCDFAPSSGFNVFYGLLFRLKKQLEGNTRTYLRQSKQEISAVLETNGCTVDGARAQFFCPMVVHRKVSNKKVSQVIERLCSCLGLTCLFGGPVLLSASKGKSKSASRRIS